MSAIRGQAFFTPIVRAGWLAMLAGTLSADPAAAATRVVGNCALQAPDHFAVQLDRLAERAPDILARIERDLGARAALAYRMVLVPPGGSDDPMVARLDAAAPEWAAGFALPNQRLGVIRMELAGRYPYGTPEAVFAHEATHILLHDAAGDRLPRWFDEGVSTWQGRRWSLEDVLVYSSSLLTADLPTLEELDANFTTSASHARLAYAASHSFVAWSLRHYGPSLIRDIVSVARDRPFPAAWRQITGASLDQAQAAWRRESLLRYRWIPIVTASSTLWVGIALLAAAAGVRRRAKAKAARAQWPEEDAQEGFEPEAEEANPSQSPPG